MTGERVSDIVTIAGQQYRVFLDESGARTYEMVGSSTSAFAMRQERRRTMMGNSKRKSGG